jgi:hypothetical protein
MRNHLTVAMSIAMAGPAVGQSVVVPPNGWPPQVIPRLSEPGQPQFRATESAPGFMGETGGGASGFSGSGSGNAGAVGDGSGVLATLSSQSYGQTAISTAQRLGVNPVTSAAIASAESNFRNVGTANGSTTAGGVWQITAPTWSDAVSRYGLPYSAADRGSSEAQAVVSGYIIREYAATTQNAIGRPATTQDVWGSYLFGPRDGIKVATASSPETPLSSLVLSTSLANNGMSNWTVGQWQSYAGQRLGGAAGHTVLQAPGT